MKKKLLIVCGIYLLCLTACGHQHNFNEATCTEPKTCVSCGETEGEALGHKWEEADCTNSKKCLVCGTTEGNPLGHTCEVGTCGRCGEVINKELITAIFITYPDKAWEASEKYDSVLASADKYSATDYYYKIISAQEYLDIVKENLQAIYNLCGKYGELIDFRAKTGELLNFFPEPIKGSDKDSVVDYLEQYKYFLTQYQDWKSVQLEFLKSM